MLNFSPSLPEQLDKIDDDMKKLLMDKLSILRSMQGPLGDRYDTSPLPTPTKTTAGAAPTSNPKEIISTTLEQSKGHCYMVYISYQNGMSTLLNCSVTIV